MRLLFSKRSIFSTLGLALVVGVTSWISIKSAQNYQSSSDIPGTFVVNTGQEVSFQQMDEAGKLKYTLFASTLVRQESGHAELKSVTLKMYDKDKNIPPWVLVARDASLSKDNQEIDLYGNVELSRAQVGQQRPIKITTPQIYVYPKKNQASTDEPVKLIEMGSNNIMTGVGMHAKFNPSRVSLLSQVRTYYDPSH